jgi:hypothetical protein
VAAGAAVKGVGGKKGRSGRKSKAEELGLVALLDKCWSEAARERCLKKLAEDCESNEFQVRNESRKLLMAYTFGKPKESVAVSNPDGSPLLQPVAEAMVKVYGK